MRSRGFQRKSKRQAAPITYCVVVEGEQTEYNYFTDIKAEFDEVQYKLKQEARNGGRLRASNCSLKVMHAGGRSFGNVVGKALDQSGDGHKRIWCVVDADFYSRLTAKDRADADEVFARAARCGIDVVFSRPCFEVWFRHHFEAHNSAWIDGDTSKREIEKLWPDYSTKPDRHWDLLRDRLDQAFANAEPVRQNHGIPPKLVEDCDASTDVDRVVMDLFFGIAPNDPDQDLALGG